MASYDQLPVYKVCYDLLIATFYQADHFKCEYKYILCERFKSEVFNSLINIYRANTQTNKQPAMDKARSHSKLVPLYYRMGKGLK